MWETANAYAGSEILTRKWFPRAWKAQFYRFGDKIGFQAYMNFHADPAYIHQAVEKSLERLGIIH